MVWNIIFIFLYVVFVITKTKTFIGMIKLHGIAAFKTPNLVASILGLFIHFVLFFYGLFFYSWV